MARLGRGVPCPSETPPCFCATARPGPATFRVRAGLVAGSGGRKAAPCSSDSSLTDCGTLTQRLKLASVPPSSPPASLGELPTYKCVPASSPRGSPGPLLHAGTPHLTHCTRGIVVEAGSNSVSLPRLRAPPRQGCCLSLLCPLPRAGTLKTPGDGDGVKGWLRWEEIWFHAVHSRRLPSVPTCPGQPRSTHHACPGEVWGSPHEGAAAWETASWKALGPRGFSGPQTGGRERGRGSGGADGSPESRRAELGASAPWTADATQRKGRV